MLVFLAATAQAGVVASVCDASSPEGGTGACTCVREALRAELSWLSGVRADGSVEDYACFDYGAYYEGISDRVDRVYLATGRTVAWHQGKRWEWVESIGNSTVMLDSPQAIVAMTWRPGAGGPDRWELVEEVGQVVRATIDSHSPPTGAFFFSQDEGGPEELVFGLDDGRVLEIVDGFDPSAAVFVP